MPIGTVLLEQGHITQTQLQQALDDSRTTGQRLDKVLVRLGFASKRTLLEAVGEQFHMPVIDLAATQPDPEVLTALPARVVFGHRCVPVRRDNGMLVIATSDPYEIAALDELRPIAGCPIELVLADEDELGAFIRAHYGVGGDTLDALAGSASQSIEVKPDADDAELAQEASVIRLVNDLLTEAVAERATDVHIEPYEKELAVRYRIDGVLHRANVPASINRFGAAIISRLKIMANLNIAEKRRPQDGRITFKARPQGKPPQEFDLRVSIIPMLFGEGVVLRVLSKTAALMSLDDLGMPAVIQKPWESMINRAHGIVLVTGPTGSGKSTTLYASLNRIVSDEVKVITVEDPVEYHVAGVNQIQVNHKVGLDFAAGLRSILRHDPDVVMIGEIRDKETAETAIQASLTGHLVFSTLHTNDAAGAVTRLLDMKVEPFLVSSSLEGVLAQRLVRRLCKDCSTEHMPELLDLPVGMDIAPGDTLRRPVGCRLCRNIGFRGRVGVYELLTISPAVRSMIMDRVDAPAIARKARADNDLALLIDDATAKVKRGITTIKEVASALTA